MRRKSRARRGDAKPSILFIVLLVAGIVLASFSPVRAHYLGESYLFLDIRQDAITGHIDLPLAELDDVLFAGEVTDGILTSEEVAANIDRIRSYAVGNVQIGTDDVWFPLRFEEYEVMDKPNARFVQLYFTLEINGVLPSSLKVRYANLFDLYPQHRALLILEKNAVAGTENPDERTSLIFTAENQVQDLDLRSTSWVSLFLTYVEHGVFHISIGLDHILFLVALLLSAVLRREDGRWVACESFRRAFMNVVAIVTLFTIAHSITLALAALEIVTLPVRFVESVIALTVIVAAIHNIFPLVEKRIALIVFFFGLFHGFGFADVLSGLGFREASLVATLLGFNIGVEVGQILIVGAIFPILYLIRKHHFYRMAGVGLGSSAIALLGLLWFTERALGL